MAKIRVHRDIKPKLSLIERFPFIYQFNIIKFKSSIPFKFQLNEWLLDFPAGQYDFDINQFTVS